MTGAEELQNMGTFINIRNIVSGAEQQLHCWPEEDDEEHICGN